MGWKTVWQWASPYVVAVISVAAAFVLKELIDPFVEQELSPFLLCAAPVVFTAWYGGIWPGLFCVSLVGMITSSFFVGHEYNAFFKGNVSLVRLGIFMLEGVMISVLAGAMHEARRRAQLYAANAETAYREAQRHVEELTRTKDALLDAQTGLRRAIADAQNANRAKSDFLANVSHELRTPLNAVIGMIDLSLQEKLTDDVYENLAVARESASMLLRLLNDLLDFSRIEVGRFELEDSPFRLRETLAEVMKTLSLRAHEKGLELAVQVHPEVPDHLVGDATRLEQVVANLVSNALKFTQKGEVVVTVEAPQLSDRMACLAFCVSDTGIGISPEDQERIFAPFTQADSSSTRQYEGIGLGLAIASQLVSAMDGRIWVESELGQGSKFYFTAWFDLAADPQRAPAIDADLTPLRGAPVLIVDDSTANRRILRDVLRDWRLRPVLAATVEQALERLRRGAHGRRFPVALVDALMPGTSGFDLAEQIRRDPELTTAVVLMLSPSDKQEYSRRCAELDVIFLEKPVAQADLAEALLTAYHGVAPAREEERPLELRSPPRAPAHVLVVEDTPANQKVTTKILEKRGHRVTAADNGREAVEMCQRRSFDVVVMDVQMPVMDGFQATAAIRAMAPPLDHNRTSPDVAIIAMTAHATRGFEERCLAAEMDAYLSKPVDAEKLIALVEVYAAGREPQAENDVPHPDTITAGDAELRWDAESNWTGLQSARSSLPNVVDFDAALERMDGNRELLADMAAFFLEDSPELLARIRDGMEDGAGDAVRRAAHSLKGLASNFGAQRTVQTARAIERAAEAGDLQQAAADFADLERCVEEVVGALQSLHV